MRKKVLSILMMVSTLSFGVIANAQTITPSTSYVSHEEIVDSLNNLIKEYNFEDEIKLEDSSEITNDMVYTTDEVNEELEGFEQYLQNKNDVTEINSAIDISNELNENTLMPSNFGLQTRSISYPRSVHRGVAENIDYSYGSGVFTINFDCIIDLIYPTQLTARESIVDIENIKVSQEGFARNLDSWNQEDEGFHFNNSDTVTVWSDIRIVSSRSVLGEKMSDSGTYKLNVVVKK